MRKKLLTFLIVSIILATTIINVSAYKKYDFTGNNAVTLKNINRNTLVQCAEKESTSIRYMKFSWTGGTVNDFYMWGEGADEEIITNIRHFTNDDLGDGYKRINYTENHYVAKGNLISVYAEQNNIASKTLRGYLYVY